MGHLPHRRKLAIEFLAKLADQFPLRPGEPMAVERHRQHVLLMPAAALDLLGIAAVTAMAFRGKS
jgi:hypothetical protein